MMNIKTKVFCGVTACQNNSKTNNEIKYKKVYYPETKTWHRIRLRSAAKSRRSNIFDKPWCTLKEVHLIISNGRSTDNIDVFTCSEYNDKAHGQAVLMRRRFVFGKNVIDTELKTTTKEGKREYMRKYMKLYRDIKRVRTYSQRLR
jgi:hypothetical protein